MSRSPADYDGFEYRGEPDERSGFEYEGEPIEQRSEPKPRDLDSVTVGAVIDGLLVDIEDGQVEP